MEENRETGLPEPIFLQELENDDFTRQLRSDYEEARDAIIAGTSAESRVTEVQRKTVGILAALYPLLRGKLYPEGASPDIAKRLLSSIEQNQPVVLCGVLAADTVLVELPMITRAAEAFSKRYENTQVKALVVDWPKLPDRSLLLGIANLIGDSDLTSKEASRDISSVGKRWIEEGHSPADLMYVPIEFNKRWQRWSGSYLEMTGPADFVEVGRQVKSWMTDEDSALSRDFGWFREFLGRQRTMRGLTPPEIIAAAEFGLTVRRAVANRIQEMARINEGLTLGITTELNPNILRCYGEGILLANVDVR